MDTSNYHKHLSQAHELGKFIDLANQLYAEDGKNDVEDVARLFFYNQGFVSSTRPDYIDACKKLLGRINQVSSEDYKSIVCAFPVLIKQISAEDERKIKEEHEKIIKEFKEIDRGIKSGLEPSYTDPWVLEETQYTSQNIRISINQAIALLEIKIKELKSEVGDQMDVALDENINTAERLLNQIKTFNYTRPLFKRIEQFAKESQVISSLYSERSSQRRLLQEDASLASLDRSNKLTDLDQELNTLIFMLNIHKQRMSKDVNEYREIISALKEVFLLFS